VIMSGKNAGSADLNKVKKAISSRNKKGGMDWKTKYIFWVGGSFATIVVACLMLIISPERGPFQIPANDQSLITHVNRNAKSWKAGASSFFEGWTVGDVKMLQGVSVSSMGSGVAPCTVPDVPIPSSFDLRDKWPQCFTSPIYNMGNCTASWAIATASALSNRYCISNPSEYGELMLSPQQLLSCDSSNRGCDGGDLDTAWKFVEREGLVSEICFPYQADGTISCSSRCSKEVPLKSASHCALNSVSAIKREILTNGPVVAPIFLVDDFLVYRGGLYQEMKTATQITDSRRQRIIHAVKIIGWGNMEGKQYWIIENSWGEDWGEHGFAKIMAGGDPEKREGILIENYVLAAVPASKKLDDIDEADEDFDTDIELDDVDDDIDADDKAEQKPAAADKDQEDGEVEYAGDD